MNVKRNYREWLIIIIFSFSSCVPILHTKELVVFKNCTTDTVYIGVSHYDDIDSVYEQAYPHYDFTANNRADTTGISLWERINFNSSCYILPDSAYSINADLLLKDADTFYFFMVRVKDAKRYSWEKIRTKFIYHKWTAKRNKNGKLVNDALLK